MIAAALIRMSARCSGAVAPQRASLGRIAWTSPAASSGAKPCSRPITSLGRLGLTETSSGPEGDDPDGALEESVRPNRPLTAARAWVIAAREDACEKSV